jgi:hypothetical protein
MIGSRVGQIETSLDPLDSEIHAIQPVRHIGILALEISETLLDLANIIGDTIKRATDMAKVLKNNVVELNHRLKLSQKSIAVNSYPLL